MGTELTKEQDAALRKYLTAKYRGEANGSALRALAEEKRHYTVWARELRDQRERLATEARRQLRGAAIPDDYRHRLTSGSRDIQHTNLTWAEISRVIAVIEIRLELIEAEQSIVEPIAQADWATRDNLRSELIKSRVFRAEELG